MIVAVTGTPGVGKSSALSVVASLLECKVIDLNDLAEKAGALKSYDRKRESWDVDVSRLRNAAKALIDKANRYVFLDGHLSHLMECEYIILLRCHPDVLKERLESRGFGARKVEENVWAEALGVIAVEVADSGVEFFEIDTTHLAPGDVANGVVSAIQEGKRSCDSIRWFDWIWDHI